MYVMFAVFAPEERHVWFPVGQHPGHGIPQLGFGPRVEVAVMRELESQHIGGVIHQNVFPYVAGL